MVEILVVDDEAAIADLVEVCLKNEGYTVYKCGSGEAALTCVARQHLDLAILDVMLPDLDGFTLCQKIREEHLFPILMLTARDEISDKVKGLDCGADDFVSKPFGMMELLARVRAVLRRTEKTPQEQQWQVGPLYVCPQRRQVQVNGQDVLLTYKEFEILSLLLQQQGRVMTREMLMDRVWGLEADRENRTLDVHIRTLRQKLGEAGHLIETVRGVGYKIGGRV